MLSDLTILFLIVHIFADYYLQSPELAARKESEWRALCLHLLIYMGLMLMCALALSWRSDWRALTAAAFSLSALHAAADILKLRLARAGRLREPKARSFIYVLDQLFHILCIVTVMERLPFIPSLPGEGLRWVLLFSLIHKPANVTFKKLLHRFEAAREEEGSGTLAGAGAVIGSLERFLCAIFIGLGQYASIGLIYTAKSISRFKKIEEDPGFAEYYLIGTLYSILFVLVSYLVIIRAL